MITVRPPRNHLAPCRIAFIDQRDPILPVELARHRRPALRAIPRVYPPALRVAARREWFALNGAKPVTPQRLRRLRFG
jgi:hypothetical protein